MKICDRCQIVYLQKSNDPVSKVKTLRIGIKEYSYNTDSNYPFYYDRTVDLCEKCLELIKTHIEDFIFIKERHNEVSV